MTNPLRVLIVEDHDDAREMMAELVSLSGGVPLTAANFEEALTHADNSQPDLGILDLGLPDVDGFEVARRLRAHPTAKSMRLIALSGFSTARDKELAQQAGFDDFFTKPIDATVLMRLLSPSAGLSL